MMILDVLFSGVTGYFLIDFVRALRAFICAINTFPGKLITFEKSILAERCAN